MPSFRARLTYANVVSTACLFILLGGGAYAASALPINSVGTEQLQRNGVTKPDVDRGAIGAAELRADSVRSPDVKDGSLVCADFEDPASCLPSTVAAGRVTTVVRSEDEVIEMTCEQATFDSQGCRGSETVAASCRPGEVATGGTVAAPPDESGPDGRIATTVTRERPDPATGQPSGWAGEAAAQALAPLDVTPPNPVVTVYAVCAS